MKLLLSVFLLTTTLISEAQSVLLKSTKCNKAAVSYAVRRSDSADRLIVGIIDSSSAEWNSITWCSMVDQLAQQKNAIVIVPEPTVSESELRCLIEMYSDSLSANRKEFISLGKSASLAVRLLDVGWSGMFLSPELVPQGTEALGEKVFVISRTNETNTIGFLRDSLTRDSHWVKVWEHSSEHPFYIDNFKSTYHRMYTWLDSMSIALSDSNTLLKSSINVDVPEVIRQGKRIEIDLFMAKQGMARVYLKDLSGKSVFAEEQFLGKGSHRLVVPTNQLEWGVYTLAVEFCGNIEKYKFMIRG